MNAAPHPPWRSQARMLRQLFRDPAPVLDELRDGYGPVCGLGVGPVRMLVVGGHDALREMFLMPTDRFRWGHRFNVLGFVVGKGSMIVSDGDAHRRRRQSVQAAFGRRTLDRSVPVIVECADAAIDRIAADLDGDRRTLDLFPLGRRLVLDAVLRVLFGDSFAARVDEIDELFRRPAAYLEAPAVRQLPHPFPFTARSQVRRDRRALDRMIDAEIADRRSQAGEPGVDVLSGLVGAGDLSDAEIRDQVVTLIGAGHDTTAASLAWMIWRASSQPGLWDRLAAEADAVLGEAPAVDPGVLGRLTLANRVMKETLRLHPAGVLAPRAAATELELGGVRVKRGTLVLWSAHLAGRDPAVWAEPLRFDPDRFLALDEDQQRLADESWVPFGRGRRNCIGFALAQMELTLMIARLAQRLEVEPAVAGVPRPVGMVVNRPAGGVPMRVRAR